MCDLTPIVRSYGKPALMSRIRKYAVALRVVYNVRFLKTIYRSRKANRLFLSLSEGDKHE